MDRPNTEPIITQSEVKRTEQCFGNGSLQSGPAGNVFWEGPPSSVYMPEVVPHLQYHNIQPVIMDYNSLSTVPVPLYGYQPSENVPTWFTNEPMFCNVMGELDNPVTILNVPHFMDHRAGVTEVPAINTHPTVPNMTGGELGANVCEPGPAYLTLDSTPIAGGYDSAKENDACASGFSNQLYQSHQAAGTSQGSKFQAASIPPTVLGDGAADPICDLKSKKPCNCTRSLCLKLYCECFANGVMCSNCNCSNCRNNPEHERARCEAMKSCLVRNPGAFKPKFAGGKSGDLKSWHNKGCNCKRSYCLKNYCECFEANIMCNSSCNCVGCKNFDTKEATKKSITGGSELTSAVLENVCSRLLTQAAEAKRENQSNAEAERMVLTEFGNCITEIVKTMFKRK